MEPDNLIARIDRTEQGWQTLTPLMEEAYELLLHEDAFWVPDTHGYFNRLPFWHSLAHA